MPIETILRPILDTVLDGVVVMDRAGVIQAWNQHSESIFGWTAAEAIGRNLGELIVPPALRQAHQRGLERFNAEGVARVLDRRLELTGLRRDGEEFPVELSITMVSREGRDLFVGFVRDISERSRAEALQALLLAELNHRAKNILAVVRAVAQMSFGSASDLAQAQTIFDGRLDSIAKANEILHAHSGQSALLGDIVMEALSGCAAPLDRVSSAGPPLCVDSGSAIMVSLAVHELCTNALKYGALSAAGGNISIRWAESMADPARFDFEWVERGGPAVAEPTRSGFGMRILKRAMELETGGAAAVAYGPAGFEYRVSGARHQGAPGSRARAA